MTETMESRSARRLKLFEIAAAADYGDPLMLAKKAEGWIFQADDPAAEEDGEAEALPAAPPVEAESPGLIPYAGRDGDRGLYTGAPSEKWKKPKAEPVPRQCLSCGESFTADGRFQRMCPPCRSSAGAGPYDPI